MDDATLDLQRKMSITSDARFHAARRLRNHGWFSQWTLASLAVGQVVISLLAALDFELAYSKSYLAFGSVFFGILVLAYSLLLGMSDFGSRAALFLECGLELSRLKHNFSSESSAAGSPIKEHIRLYHDILGKYENHAEIDYLFARTQFLYSASKLKALPEGRERYKFFLKKRISLARLYLWHLMHVSHYLGSVALVVYWIYYGIAFA